MLVVKGLVAVVVTWVSAYVLAGVCQQDNRQRFESGQQQASRTYGGHSAHIHGEARMNIILDGSTLFVEFFSPAINVVGFEHKVRTKEDKKVVERVSGVLLATEKILSVKGGKCRTTSAEVNMEALTEKDHSDRKERAHADITAAYHIDCETPSAIKSLEIKLFEYMNGIERLETQWILNAKQGTAVLNAKNKVIPINRP